MLQHDCFSERRIMFCAGESFVAPLEKAMLPERSSHRRSDVRDMLDNKTLQSPSAVTGIMVPLRLKGKSSIDPLALPLSLSAENEQIGT